MKKCEIRVLTNINNQEETHQFLAIKNDDVIKYIDLENNKMTIDMENNLLERENDDYLFTIDFMNNIINIYIKKVKKTFNKGIKTLLIEKKKNSFFIKYQLIDEDVINEYYVKF